MPTFGRRIWNLDRRMRPLPFRANKAPARFRCAFARSIALATNPTLYRFAESLQLQWYIACDAKIWRVVILIDRESAEIAGGHRKELGKRQMERCGRLANLVAKYADRGDAGRSPRSIERDYVWHLN